MILLGELSSEIGSQILDIFELFLDFICRGVSAVDEFLTDLVNIVKFLGKKEREES